MTEAPSRLERAARSFPRVAATLSILVACLVLIGWFAEITPLTSLGAWGPPMAASTAIMTLLASVALWSSRATFAGGTQRLVRICAIAISAIAVLALLDQLAGIDVGLDRMLPYMKRRWNAATPTAVAFLLIAAAALCEQRRYHHVRPKDVFALGALAIATVALIGYLFDVPALYGTVPAAPHIGMSLPTAVVVGGLGIGYLACDIEHSLAAVLIARDAGGVAARRLFGAAILFPPGAAVLLLGPRLGWYSYSFGEATVLLLAIAEGTAVILATATALSRADIALRTSEAHVRQLVQQASEPIFVADLDGTFIDVNEAGSRLVGYTHDELVGRNITDLVSTEDATGVAETKLRLLAGQTTVTERLLRRSDGTMIPIEVSSKIFPDGRWQGIVRDITERKRNDAALARAAETERGLRAELESLMTAISRTVGELPRSSVDAVLRTIAEQARMLSGAGYAAAALGSDPAKPFDRWVDIGMSEADRAKIERLPRPVGAVEHVGGGVLAVPIMHGDRVLGALYLGNKHDGSDFTANDASIIGRLADRVAAALETASVYATESQLRAWLRAIIDQLPDGVIVVDEHAQVKAMNRAVRDMALLEPTQIDPWGNPAVFDIRDRDQRSIPFDDLPIIQALRRGETVRRNDLVLRQHDGRFLPIEAAAGPVRGEDGRITGAVVIVTDISERKEQERLREEWIAVVAHDLRQPLNTILLWSDRLASLVKEERAQAAIERVSKGAWRLNRMIHDLLDAARLQAHQLSIDPRTLDAIELARTTIDNAKLGNPDAEIQLSAAGEHELVWADGDRIQQVLANLVSNALKYGTPGKPVRVEIRGQEHRVEIAVINEGPDIPAEERERLFSRFSRTEHARTAKIPGIGLGLYICRGLVEAHGGTIRVDSDHGIVAFRFTLRRPPE